MHFTSKKNVAVLHCSVLLFFFSRLFLCTVYLFVLLFLSTSSILPTVYSILSFGHYSLPCHAALGLLFVSYLNLKYLFCPSQCWIYWKLTDHVWFVLMKVHSKRQNEEEAAFRAPVGGFYPADAADCVPVSLSTNYLFCVCRVKRFGQSLCKQHSGLWAKGNETTLCVFV